MSWENLECDEYYFDNDKKCVSNKYELLIHHSFSVFIITNIITGEAVRSYAYCQ